MNWFVFSILSIFALATAELTQQHLLNDKNAFTERTSAVLTFVLESLLTIPFLFALGLSSQIFSIFDPAILPRVLFVSFICSFGMVFYFKSFLVKNISISTIFISLSVVVATLLGIVFYDESTSYLKFLGIAFIMMAIIFANYKNVVLEKNHWYGLLAGLIFGVCYSIDKGIVLIIHPMVYIFWTFAMVAAWGFVLGKREVLSSVKGKALMEYKPIVISALGYFVFNVFSFTAYRVGGEVGRVDAINNTQIFLIILFEFFIMKHTKGMARKLISAGLALLGIYILGSIE